MFEGQFYDSLKVSWFKVLYKSILFVFEEQLCFEVFSGIVIIIF